jgi:hypothetical protein
MNTISVSVMNRKRYVSTLGAFALLFIATLIVAPLIGPTRIDLAKALSLDQGITWPRPSLSAYPAAQPLERF